MNDSKENPFDMSPAVSAWMKLIGQAWGPMVNQLVKQTADPWSGGSETPKSESRSSHDATSKAQAAMSATVKNWQTLATAMATPESMSALFKGAGAMPEVLLKLAQTSMGSVVELHQKMVQRFGRMGKSVEAYQFEDIEENINRLWTDIYEKEFRQFFHIPQLGLTRTYQERAGEAADKYNLFQSNLNEFLRMLSLPFSHALQVMQDKLGQMAEKGELTDDTKFYYNMWVKVLEGHFMTLFQTPEYIDTLTRTINSLANYTAARDAAVEDLFGLLPVAKKSDMADMARELYEVKKRLRELEKDQR